MLFFLQSSKAPNWRYGDLEVFGSRKFSYLYYFENPAKNQQKHHRKEDTLNELKRLWKENGMNPDERYFT